MTNKYAVIDDDGVIVNMILWDGKSEVNPGEGLSLIPSGEGFIIDGRIADGVYIPPVRDDENNVA